MINLRNSNWTFATSAGGEAPIGEVVTSGGILVLREPAKKQHRFAYHGLGISVGAPVSRFLPKVALPRIVLNGKELGATGATTDFPSGGTVYASAPPKAN